MKALIMKRDPFLGSCAWIVVGIPLGVVLATASRNVSWAAHLGWFPLIFVAGVILFGILFGPGAIVIGVIHSSLMDAIAERCNSREQFTGWSIATGALLAPLALLPATLLFNFIPIGAREIAVSAICGGVCGAVSASWATQSTRPT